MDFTNVFPYGMERISTFWPGLLFRAEMTRTYKEVQVELVEKIKVVEKEKSKPSPKPHPIIKKLLWSSMSFSIIIYLNVSWTIITVQSRFWVNYPQENLYTTFCCGIGVSHQYLNVR